MTQLMENPVNAVESLFESAKEYVKTTYQLFKLRLIQSTVTVVTSLVMQTAVIVIFYLSLLALTVGVALWLGEVTGKDYYGFFIVAGFYFLVALIARPLIRPIIRRVIAKQIIEQTLDENDA